MFRLMFRSPWSGTSLAEHQDVRLLNGRNGPVAAVAALFLSPRSGELSGRPASNSGLRLDTRSKRDEGCNLRFGTLGPEILETGISKWPQNIF